MADEANGLRAMLLRIDRISAEQRRREHEFNASKLPKDYLKSKTERKKKKDT
jgi:hypothetical protein